MPAARPFDDIRSLLGKMPKADEAARAAAREREAQLTKPAGSLGRLEEIAEWMAGWQATRAPACRQSAGRGLRRQSRRRRAGRLGLSAVGHSGDGGEFHRRRRRDQPDLQDLRHLAQGLRARAREADRRHHPGAGARREGLRGDDGLRHGGARLRAGPARARRNGHRQHDAGGGDLSRALRRRSGGLGRPRRRRRRRGPHAQGRRRARGGRAP